MKEKQFKDVIKEEEKAPEAPREESKPTVILTEVDAYIHERLKSQPPSVEAISDRVDAAYLEGKHRLALPAELEKKYGNDFSFRWIDKDKRMIDRALDIRGWVLANRLYFPNLSKHLFSANGTIERGSLILGFMPKRKAEALRAIPGNKSNERLKNLPVEKWRDGGETYYKPTLTEEKDGETITTGIQPDNFNKE